MTMAELKQLPLSERIQLVQDLWDSVADDAPLTLTPELRARLDERFAAHVQDPSTSVAWEVVRAQLLGAAH